MKANNRRRIAAVLLALTVLAGICSGCGGKKADTAAATPAQTGEKADTAIHVSSVGELMDNLKSIFETPSMVCTHFRNYINFVIIYFFK